MDEKPSLEEALVHFGVKGMKWGVRKKAELSTERRTIAKGHQLQNVSAGKAVDTSGRRIFASHTAKDNLAYRSKYARVLRAISDDETYANTLVTTKKIKVASEKDAYDEFKKLYDKDPAGMTRVLAESQEALVRSMFGLGEVANLKTVDANFKTYSKKGEDWLEKSGYDLFTTASGTNLMRKEVADGYYNALAKRGFDAMIDHTDKKAKLADDPIIFLKPKDTVKVTETVPLSVEDIKLAKKLYKQEAKR